jgi:class 3 adenylate cyclase
MYCGQPIAAPSRSDEIRLSHLAASVPQPLAEKMRGARRSGERKIVTVLFADVVGSTAMAEHMDPEEWTEMMNGAFDWMSPSIYKYEGTIARLMGDALLAFFGAPVAHEDDPSRAIRSAMDMLEAMRDYAELTKARFGMDFAIRIGINTGSVVVGEVGSDLKYEYTAMGDAVNLASRLQSAARPMRTLISQDTYRFVAPLFEFNDLGQIEVKGKTEPVQIYEVVGMKTQPGKVRGLSGLTSPMVGRQAELSALTELSHSLRGGQGGVAIITGEAGLGKSRLLAEWQLDLARQGMSFQWLEGHCLSYGQRLAYHLLINLLQAILGVQPTASEADTHAALVELVHQLFENELEIYPYLGHLLSLNLGGAALEKVQSLDPQSLQNQYRIALTHLFQRLSARNPLLVVLEDIHWADPASVELITQLMPQVKTSRILFCILARPDLEAPGWRLVMHAEENLKEYLTEIILNPLSESDSRQLVSNLLEIEALPDGIRERILGKAEGNPFFVEEVIRMLIDTGTLQHNENRWELTQNIEHVEIPDNLQGLLLARIDRLPENARRTLRVASVIGRQFSVKVLEQVMNLMSEG